MNRERRRAVRRMPGDGDPLSRVRLRAGPELQVAEISDVGALVRTTTRLLPGTHVDVHLLTVGGRILQRARIARASVWAIDASGVAYQVALAFDAPVDSSARRVGTTRPESLMGRFQGERLPAQAASGRLLDDGDTRAVASPTAELAPDLDRASCTFVKESWDVDH